MDKDVLGAAGPVHIVLAIVFAVVVIEGSCDRRNEVIIRLGHHIGAALFDGLPLCLGAIVKHLQEEAYEAVRGRHLDGLTLVGNSALW